MQPDTPYSPRECAAVNQVREAVLWASEALEFSHQEVGQAMGGASPRTVARWRGGEQRPHPPAVVAAEALLGLSQALDAVFPDEPDRMHAWLHEPIPGLGHRTPLRAIIEGEAREVLTLLANVDADTFM